MGSELFKLKHYLTIILAALLMSTFSGVAQDGAVKDTSLSVFSVKDLVKIRKILAREREDLLKEQEKIRQRGVEVTQEFLGKSKDENSNQDKILIRVAEYYIEEEDLNFERRYDKYEADYEVYEQEVKAFEAGQLAAMPAEPKLPQKNYQEAIAIYDLIIRNFQESDLVDDAYYNKAYLLNEMEEFETAQQIFQSIIDEFPESEYAPEAYMKLAESFFYPEPGDDTAETILKLNKAIQLYKNVLQYKDSPRYDEALYKLGWSYYRLAGENPDYYTDAIVYFMAVIQDIEKLKALDPTGEIIRADVKPEALQFVAASFIDPAYNKSGVDNARTFIEKLDKPSFGVEIMYNIGDRYAKITRWNDAIQAYNELLMMYPDYLYAPGVQKKIADAYIASEEYEQAFAERKLLFESYNPKSEWYARLEARDDLEEQITAMDEAYSLTEEAFRTNITYLYNKALAKESDGGEVRADFEEFVDLCKLYLDNYPTDEKAYEINWALAYVFDTRLGRFEEAFAEYIRVSNDYLEDDHQFDAAINAINSADTLVKISVSSASLTEIGADQPVGRAVKTLTPEEKMLAEAYDNFIKLFPDSPETPTILAAAGALYYNKRQYDLAKKYYKTMVTKFPSSQQKSVGLLSLMNSYFFLGQYRDSEIVAKKILNTSGIPEEQIKVAQSRIGESIFKNGERLEQQGNHAEAAKEYRRVYEEAASYVSFVDNSLFRSARNFEQAGEWLKAIETYEILVSDFPESKQLLSAYINIASDYKELEDFLNVAKTNERIFDRFSGTPEAENALYNASLFYEKAEAWEEAIRANNLYIGTYPSNPESKDLLFENARFYLKLDDLASANRIYDEFASQYPNDPLTIEAFYNRGVYYFERTKNDSAKIEFNKAIARSSDFARAGRDPNLYFAAESNYKLGQILYREYKDIQLSYPQNTLRAQLERKQAKLTEVEGAFTQVISLGSIRSFEAMYRIAEAYEEFANAIANQALPEELSRDERLVQKTQVFNASVPAYERAVNEYKNVLINLPALAEKLDVSMDTTNVITDTTPEVNDTTVAIRKEAEVDSSSEVALKWYGRAKDNISLIQYNVAERSSDFVTDYLRVENPETGLRSLVFQDQVLRTLVAQQVSTTIDAHLKNLEIANELGLENKYVEESKRKILLSRNVLATEYEGLFYQAIQEFRNALPNLEDLIEQGEGAVSAEGLDYYDYQDTYVMQMIYNMDQYAKIAMNQYKITLQLAQEHNINSDTRLTTEERMFNFGYDAGQQLTQLAVVPTQKSEEFITKYDSTQNENYSLGGTFFDDQAFELGQYSQDIYAFAYDISKEFQIENIWTQLMLVQLVQLDPVTYLEDLPKREFNVVSDDSWKATTRYTTGWNTNVVSDGDWGAAKVIPTPIDLTFSGFDSLNVAPPAIWVSQLAAGTTGSSSVNPLELEDRSVVDSLAEDNTLDQTSLETLRDTSLAILDRIEEPDTLEAFFRQRVQLDSKPIDGWISVTGDKTYHLYINDVYITGGDMSPFETVEYLPFDIFSEFLKEGENLIAMSVKDFDGPPRQGLKFHMLLKLLPGEVSQSIEQIRAKMRQDNVDPVQLQKTGITNKNRIVD